jgi:hypothetical protein
MTHTNYSNDHLSAVLPKAVGSNLVIWSVGSVSAPAKPVAPAACQLLIPAIDYSSLQYFFSTS